MFVMTEWENLGTNYKLDLRYSFRQNTAIVALPLDSPMSERGKNLILPLFTSRLSLVQIQLESHEIHGRYLLHPDLLVQLVISKWIQIQSWMFPSASLQHSPHSSRLFPLVHHPLFPTHPPHPSLLQIPGISTSIPPSSLQLP